MDNLGSHKVAGVREAIQARGAELRYLPPYCTEPPRESRRLFGVSHAARADSSSCR